MEGYFNYNGGRIPAQTPFRKHFGGVREVSKPVSRAVRFSLGTEARLRKLAIATGRAPDDLVVDAMTGYLAELMEACNMLDARYDDIKSGRVQRVDDDEACLQLRQKSQNRRGS